MRCEDFPCCGHEPGCCPDFDESGRQLNMVCTCGAKLPINSRYSICDSCLNTPGPDDDPRDFYDGPDEDYDDADDEDFIDDPEPIEDFGWDGGMEM